MALQDSGILPTKTVYFSEVLDFHLKHLSQTRKDKDGRLLLRQAWLERAVRSVEQCNIVFLDPDNGLQIDSCSKKSQMRSGKYVFYDEVEALCKGKDACVIYHHLNRHKDHGTHKHQIKSRANDLLKKIWPTGHVFALRYKPYSPRAYFILTSGDGAPSIEKAIKNFRNGSYGQFWDSFYEFYAESGID